MSTSSPSHSRGAHHHSSDKRGGHSSGHHAGGGGGRGGHNWRGPGSGGRGAAAAAHGHHPNECDYGLLQQCTRKPCAFSHIVHRVASFEAAGTVRSIQVHTPTGALFFSDGARVHIKAPDFSDMPGGRDGVDIVTGVPGQTLVESIAVSGRWLFVSYSSPLPAVPGVAHPSAMPTGLIQVADLSSPFPTPYVTMQVSSPGELAAHRRAAVGTLSIELPGGGEPYFITGSMDGAIKMWQFSGVGAFACQAFDDKNGHVAGVRAIAYHGDVVFTGGFDRTIKIWDAATRCCVQTVMPPAPAGSGVGMGGGGAGGGARRDGPPVLAGVGFGGSDQGVVALEVIHSSPSGSPPLLIAAYQDGTLVGFDITHPRAPLTATVSVKGGYQGMSDGLPVILTSMCILNTGLSDGPLVLCGYSNGSLVARHFGDGLANACITIRGRTPKAAAGHVGPIRALKQIVNRTQPGVLRFASGGDDGRVQVWHVEAPV